VGWGWGRESYDKLASHPGRGGGNASNIFMLQNQNLSTSLDEPPGLFNPGDWVEDWDHGTEKWN